MGGKSNSGTVFISKKELVEQTGLSLPCINRHLKDGIIPFVKLGKRVLIPASYLSELESKVGYATKKDSE